MNVEFFAPHAMDLEFAAGSGARCIYPWMQRQLANRAGAARGWRRWKFVLE